MSQSSAVSFKYFSANLNSFSLNKGISFNLRAFHLPGISSVVTQNTMRVPGRKNTNTNSISLQPLNQIMSESVSA